MHKKICSGGLAAFGFLLLILDAKTAIMGATEGITLCLYSVIPSIFPFLILSALLTSALTGTKSRLLHPIGKKLGMPKGSEGIFLTGLLGGYPTGAQAVGQAYKHGSIGKENAERMLAFCSNAGPSFLFGIVGAQFAQWWIPWALWCIHILSAFTVGLLTPKCTSGKDAQFPSKTVSVPQAVRHGVYTMGYICGWVVLFRVILAFLDRWLLWLFPLPLQVCVHGILELANGCCGLETIENVALRFLTASAMLAFGGICVTMQTATVVGDLKIGWYIYGKIQQMLISIALAAGTAYLLPFGEGLPTSALFVFPVAAAAMLLYLFPRKRKKRVAFSRRFVYTNFRKNKGGNHNALSQGN